jgi:hypothetical protein
MNPEIHIESVRQVFNDGNHNGFPDFIRFRDTFYMVFRCNPIGHLGKEGTSGRIMSSPDGIEWTEIHHFEVPGRDLRDHHFVEFNGKLFVYVGGWLVKDAIYEYAHILGFGLYTTDGTNWSEPKPLEGTLGHFIWRTLVYDGKVFLNARRRRGFVSTGILLDDDLLNESTLMKSDDGFTFKPVIFFPQKGGDETAFQFEDDGTVIAVMRTIGPPPHNAVFWRAKPPYTDWTHTMLHRFIGGPMLAKWGDRYLVGGRHFDGDLAGGTEHVRTSLGWLEGLGQGETPHLVEGISLPSGGDTSYTNFVALSDTEGLLAYYSSHEGSGTKAAPAAIYIARLRLA